MIRSKRMKTIVNLAEDKKDVAARQLAQGQQMLEKSKLQLEEMKRCRIEYAGQLEAGSGQTSASVRTASELQGIRIFMQQLDVAIQQLERQVQDFEVTSQRQKDHWLKLRNKSKALLNIKTRYQETEAKEDEQRDQFEIDELSQRSRNKEPA